MRRFTFLTRGLLLASVAASSVLAQGDSTKVKPDSAAKAPAGAANLEGKWIGSISTPNGEMQSTAVIKKEKDGYVGTVSGLEGDVPLKNITIDGDKVTASAVMSMQGQGFEVWYSFVLKGDTMTGGLSASIQGQTMAFDLILKRAP